jgi:diguanylate cyclase (GGDEF)-like protein/PAS domain S-box-containing protein
MTTNPPHQVSSDDLENCSKEVLQTVPLVQSHGFLLACEQSGGKVTFASRNVCSYLNVPRQQILGSCVYDLFVQEVEHIEHLFGHLSSHSPELLALKFRAPHEQSTEFEIVGHISGNLVIIEAMPLSGESASSSEERQLEKVVAGLSTLNQDITEPEFLHSCATQIHELTGYQRVIIYRFLPDWSGEVIAEATQAGVETRFLGLRFPATDIPAQARALYKTNLLRVIGDVLAPPIGLDALVPDSVLDQSHSLLRSPSVMHLGYLQNMGVRATMTISLLKSEELWGMVTCHHHEPRTPPVQLRRSSKLLSALIAQAAMVRIDAIVQRHQSAGMLQMQETLACMARAADASENFVAKLVENIASAASLLNFQAFGIHRDGEWLQPLALPPELLNQLLQYAVQLGPNQGLFINRMVDSTGARPDAWSPWSGVAVLRLGFKLDSYLVLLREELVKQVKWAGAPDKREVILPGGTKVLGPRESFASWTQIVHGESAPWSDPEQSMCLSLARGVAEAFTFNAQRAMSEEVRLLAACMANLNDVVVVTDASGTDEPAPKIIYVNDAFVTQTGYSRAEVIGRSPRFLGSDKTNRVALDQIRAAMNSWRPVTVELVNKRKDGSDYWSEVSIVPVADENGWYRHWVSVQKTVDERKRAEQDIQKLVYYDTLTSLPNRRLLMDRLRVALSNASRYGRNGALMFLDLDNFKNVNDTEGHQVGDELLRQVAMRLVAEMRLEDTVARIGGDEFVVLVEGLSRNSTDAATAAQLIADKVIGCLGEPFKLAGGRYSGSASLGISLFFDGTSEQSDDELVKQADFAMYQAKAAGKNGWRFYDSATQLALQERNSLEADLKEALNGRQLQIYYQPIVDRSRNITGVEALLRWHHRARGWVPPAEFIPIAEADGLILPIGKWVLESACNLLTQWADLPEREHWTIAVNVSAAQLRQPDFVNHVEQMLGQTRCNPRRLKLELTESLLQSDFEASVQKMNILRALGIRFSIDDFGTGYSSLAYLRRLPISVLKIDRSFVKEIETDDSDRAICQTILALGRTLKLSIVAEGVETSAQFEFLDAHGCDSFQGYLFSKALPLQDLDNLFV